MIRARCVTSMTRLSGLGSICENKRWFANEADPNRLSKRDVVNALVQKNEIPSAQATKIFNDVLGFISENVADGKRSIAFFCCVLFDSITLNASVDNDNSCPLHLHLIA